MSPTKHEHQHVHTHVRQVSAQQVQPQAQPRLREDGTGIDLHGWSVRARNGPIVSSAREAALAEELRIRLPGMLFGDSKVFFEHVPSGIRLNFNARDALQGVGPADPAIQVRAASAWMKRKNSSEFPTLENPSDWTFTTRYNGTVEVESRRTPVTFRVATEKLPVVGINYDVLRRTDIPILYYSDVLLFEDELDDNGTASYRVRLRIMHDCFFILARFFLRVDGVLLRVYDTRYYHEFDSSVLVREFTTRESDYAIIAQTLPPAKLRDSDVVADRLPLVTKIEENLAIPNSPATG